jgi:hypothetical protein
VSLWATMFSFLCTVLAFQKQVAAVLDENYRMIIKKIKDAICNIRASSVCLAAVLTFFKQMNS